MTGRIGAIRSMGFNGAGLQEDHRPESSPYASDIWYLDFQNRVLQIPRQLLEQCPGVVAKTKPAAFSNDRSRRISFDDISLDTGHSLVHFLHTGSYECLRPQGNSPAERDAAELATAFRVHAAAASWKLPALCQLAAGEIIRLSGELSLPVVIDTLEQANPAAISIPRVGHYLQSRIMASCKNSTRASASAILEEIGTPNSMSKLILKCMVQFASRPSPYREASSPEPMLEEPMPEEPMPEEYPPEECSPVELSSSQLETYFSAGGYRRDATVTLRKVEGDMVGPDDDFYPPPADEPVEVLQPEPLYSVPGPSDAPAVDEEDVTAKEAALQVKKAKKDKKKKKKKAPVLKYSESDNASPHIPSPPSPPPEPPLSYPQSPVLMPSVGNEETAVPF